MNLGELASRLGAELRGDAELEVTGVSGLEEAGATEVTFVANPRYTALARTTKAAAVEMLKVFFAAPPVPQVSTNGVRRG